MNKFSDKMQLAPALHIADFLKDIERMKLTLPSN